ncbi:MAG: hypothetical protein LBH26_04230, partial [Treponema sp.]|nr:hypothetical protein [Treponema sp.]
KGTGTAANTVIDESVHYAPVYRARPPATTVTITERRYTGSGFTNSQPFPRGNSVYNLSWYLDYTTWESTDNGDNWTQVGGTTRLVNFGKWAIDATNNGNYLDFQQSGSYLSLNRAASIKIGPYVSGTYVGTDTAPRTPGKVWTLNTALDFNEDYAALGFEIKNMPKATVPVYLWNWQVGTTTKSNYQAITFQIRN